MKTLELWYPANNKPWRLTQAWGILNLAYQRFGFTRHNGVDIPIAPDKAIYCPQRAKVQSVNSFPNGGGNQVQLITTDMWNVNGANCYVLMVFMHNETILVKPGDICEIGQKITVPDNTGFSTGPHTHFGCYRLNADYDFFDKNDENGSFDPEPFFNGFYASEKPEVINNLNQQLSLLQKVVNLIKLILFNAK